MKDKDLITTRLGSPFGLMRRLSDEMERMFDDFNIRQPFAVPSPAMKAFDWLPATEVLQKDRNLIVRAELPGLEKEDVKIDITDEFLTLQGERKEDKREKGEGFVRTERCYGTFFRQIALPEGAQPDAAKAVFKNGVLEITVPVLAKQPTTGRRLPIEEAKKELVGA